jgi:ribosomal-protein-alanine N-acetyltransferase
MSIREATPYEADAMAAVHEACFDRPWSAAEIDRLMIDGFGLISEEAAAFLIARVSADEAEILTVAVDPAFRRQGWGRRLIDAAIEVARDQGAVTLFLEVGADNAAAISVYHAAGFQLVGKRPGYYYRPDGSSADAMVMRRSLNRA